MNETACLKALTAAMTGFLLASTVTAGDVPGRWSAEKANKWYAEQPWLVGCNFLPSTSVNDVEMWQADSFDEATINRELGWAHELGFNTVRVFLNYVVWETDADGLKKRFDQFLAIADKNGIRVMPVLLDDCNFAGRTAAIGKQPDPVPGVHNSQWVSSPPLKMVDDKAAWPRLERYVKDFVGTFANDKRVVIWDSYNEPGNSNMGEKSLPLMEAACAWVRESKPTQPLTIGAWLNFSTPMQQRMMELSDVISFHGYDDLKGIEAKLKICSGYGRPVLCSESYRNWHYQPDHVIPSEPKIPGHEKFKNPDVPTIYQIPGQTDKWYMSYIAFNGQGYNSFVVESTDLVKWTHPRLAMGFGKQGEFDFGGCVVGAFLYESYDIKAPRNAAGLKKHGEVWADKVVAAETRLARPSPQQYAWHEQERIMFLCLDPCTWQGREYDNHSTPLSDINPAQLDAGEFCRGAKLWDARAGEVIRAAG